MCSLIQLTRFATQLKFVLILSLLPDIVIKTKRSLYTEYLQADIENCSNCYGQQQQQQCMHLYENIIEPGIFEELENIFILFGKKRNVQRLRLSNHKVAFVLAKYYVVSNDYKHVENVQSLAQIFENGFPKLAGFNYCTLRQFMTATQQTPRLMSYFQALGHQPQAIWLYMLENISPLLMPELERLGMPVPEHYASCGFTLFQAYAGSTLTNFQALSTETRLSILKQILELAIKFSYGFDNFRIYLTDLTVDNLAYNEAKEKLTIIDLDTIFIVDTQNQNNNTLWINKYEIISSDGFAYDPQEFCKSSLYDVNIYEACKLLQELLQADFIMRQYEQLMKLINTCIICPMNLCTERFGMAEKLIKHLDDKIKERS